MNYHNACNILELSFVFTHQELKHSYYIKALKYHPDKNHDSNATGKFQEVLASYNFLREYEYNYKRQDRESDIEKERERENEKENERENDNANTSYSTILEDFMSGRLDKTIDIGKLLTILHGNYTELSLKLLKQFPKNMLLTLNKFVNQYSDILHINDAIIVELDNLIRDYTCNDQTIILNPSLNNILNDEVYKLVFNDETYYIPLWHHELVYDISGKSLIVQCNPELPQHIEIDQYNNIYIKVTATFSNIFEMEYLDIIIGAKIYTIPVSELYIKRYQRYEIKRKGLALINTNDVYNILERANIYVNVYLID